MSYQNAEPGTWIRLVLTKPRVWERRRPMTVGVDTELWAFWDGYTLSKPQRDIPEEFIIWPRKKTDAGS